MEGVDHGKRARDYWSNHWQGTSFMAIGVRDRVPGEAPMEHLRSMINHCPEPLKLKDAGHFVQEYGGCIAETALQHFGIDQ